MASGSRAGFLWPDWITGLFKCAFCAERDVALRLQTGNKTRLRCISPCDKVIAFFFFFNLVPPGLLYEFLIFVSRWDISRSCDIPVENTQRSQRAGLWKKTVLLLIWSNPIATFSPVSLLNWLALVNIKGNLHPRMLVLCLQTALSYISCNFFFSNGLGDNKRLTVNNHDNTVFPYYVIAS